LPARQDIVHVVRYAVSVPLTTDVRYAGVFQVDSSRSPSAAAVTIALGSSAVYFPNAGAAYMSRPGTFKLTPAPADPADAARLARAFLVERGLLPPEDRSTPTVIHNTPPAPNVPFYSIHFPRFIQNVPSYGFWAPGVSLQVQDSGDVTFLEIVHRPIASGWKYAIRSQADAWQQVKAGHWYVADGTANNGRIDVAKFVADRVELCYRESEVNDEQPFLAPMWCFTDTTTSAGFPLRLYYPALLDADLNWSVPAR
jgi:hypothetical protein